MMQKGQILIFVLVGILVIVGIAGGAYYLGRQTNKPQLQNQLINSFNSLKQSPQFNFTTACKPEFGQDGSVFKVFIVSNGKVPYFVNQKNQVINQFKTISPFNENFNKIAFYTLEIPAEDKVYIS